MSNAQLISEIRQLKRAYNLKLGISISMLVLGFFTFIFGGFGSVMSFGGRGFGSVGIGFLMFALGIVLLILSNGAKKKLKTYVGEKITASVLSEFMDLWSFEPNAYTDKEVLTDLSILPSHNQRSGSDLIRGRYQGHELELCDLLLQQVTSTGKTTTVITVFKGQLLSYSLGKLLNGYVEVTKRTAGKTGGFLKRVKNWGTSMSKGRDFESVEMENDEFNSRFDVRAEDPHTAFLVLTPQFMEKLMEVSDRVSTNFCFTQDKVWMAIRSDKDYFEVKGDFTDEADIERFRESIREDLRSSLSLLDILRKNEYLF